MLTRSEICMPVVTERSFLLCPRIETRLYLEVETFFRIFKRREKKERGFILLKNEIADRKLYSAERAGKHSAMSSFLRTGFSFMFRLFAALLPIG